jgi:hypothetical protein
VSNKFPQFEGWSGLLTKKSDEVAMTEYDRAKQDQIDHIEYLKWQKITEVATISGDTYSYVDINPECNDWTVWQEIQYKIDWKNRRGLLLAKPRLLVKALKGDEDGWVEICPDTIKKLLNDAKPDSKEYWDEAQWTKWYNEVYKCL